MQQHWNLAKKGKQGKQSHPTSRMHAELWGHKQADQTHHLSPSMQYAIWQGKQSMHP
jgi:hypothetical protein